MLIESRNGEKQPHLGLARELTKLSVSNAKKSGVMRLLLWQPPWNHLS